MDKQDLTEYSEQELSLIVFNDEGFYSIRDRIYLFDVLDEHFIYTDEQKQVLIQDIDDDANDE